MIERVDLDEEKVYVNRSKDEIKDAPEYDADRLHDETYRSDVSAYYGSDR